MIRSNASLIGNGTIHGPVTVQNGGTLAPGASIGKLMLINSIILQGSTIMEISKTGSTLTNLTSFSCKRKSLMRKLAPPVHLLQTARCPSWRLRKERQQAQLVQRGVEIFRHMGDHSFESFATDFQVPQPNALELSEQVMDFNGLVLLPPLDIEFGAQPISQETNPHMIAHSVGSSVKHRAHSQIGFQVTKSIFDLQEVLVMVNHTGLGNLLSGGVGPQQIKAIADCLAEDQVAAAAPLQ